MGGLRSKLLLAMIAFFAGFATAIYTLAPSYDSAGGSGKTELHTKQVASSSTEFALKFNSGMRECFGFAEEKAVELGRTIKAKLSERYKDREG